MIGIGVAQILPFLALPLLTRLYTEQEFASYTSFIAIASILAIGAGGRFQYAIMIPKKNSEAINVFSLSIYLTVLYTILLFFIVFFLKDFDTKIGNNIYLIPVYVLFFGTWNAFSNLSIRYKTFKYNSFAKVLQSILYIFSSIGLGLSKIWFNGLILGKVVGVFTSSIYLFKKSIIKLQLTSIEKLKTVAIRYIDYPKYGLIPAFLDIASVQGLVLVMTMFYSKDDLGYLGLTMLVLNAPMGLIGTSFKEVFYQKITSLIIAKQFDKAHLFFKKSAIGLLIVGIPICFIIGFFGKEIFSVFFGSDWERSGVFASILSLPLIVQLVVSPLSTVFNATNKLKIASYWQGLYFTTTFTTLGISAYVLRLETIQILYVYVFHEIILYSLYFILQNNTLKRLS